jgi:hypothetical protein
MLEEVTEAEMEDATETFAEMVDVTETGNEADTVKERERDTKGR